MICGKQNIDKIKEFFKLREEILDYFGHEDEWERLSIMDYTDMYWCIDMRKVGKYYVPEVLYFDDPIVKEVYESCNYYVARLYQHPEGEKIVYEREDYTMITMSIFGFNNGNKFLGVFDSSKEMKFDDKGMILK